MDVLIEIFLEIYMELMLLVIPEGKGDRKRKGIAMLLAFLSLFGIMALAVWGIVWIVDSKNPWGWIPVILAVLLSAVQIALGIRLYIRKYKKK